MAVAYMAARKTTAGSGMRDSDLRVLHSTCRAEAPAAARPRVVNELLLEDKSVRDSLSGATDIRPIDA